MFDPENEMRRPVSFGRLDMRSSELRARQKGQRVSSLVEIREQIVVEAERRVMAAERILIQAQEKLAEVKDIQIRKRQRFTYAEIERQACQIFGVTRNQLLCARRHEGTVFARQFVMYWAIRLTPMSYPLVGRLMGHRDHTTVLHGCRAYVAKRAAQGRYLRPAR
jgi:chromosomal replication initiator protein